MKATIAIIIFAVVLTMAFLLVFKLVMPRGGLLALVAAPMTFFAVGLLSTSMLKIPLTARIAFSIMIAIGVFGAFLGVVAIQGITGGESGLSLFIGFSINFVFSYAIGYALGLVIMMPFTNKYKLSNRFLFALPVGFGAGAIIASTVMAFVVVNKFYTNMDIMTAITMSIPGVIGAATMARVMNRINRTNGTPPNRGGHLSDQ